ncbi:rho GTPase-activating protein gacU isoform X3 [Topomyia yanbarensis]|uniref:rho GTPase-activating protein gacU isoform X3 n=1 Tax=Topomyia yanbarensis TaxID=2498891 RepID=UPI00273B5635|nr:rho GTPase-activating protein gacU isoform X3 [Topomyia yanbarensis]
MEKSFDEVTVSSLSDLRLESVSGTGVTIADFESQQQQSSSSPFHRETSQLDGGNQSNNNNNGQQRNNGSNGNENNLNRLKKPSKKHHSHHHQQQQQQPMFNPSKHLDVWLANAIRGLESASGLDPSDQLDSPTLKGNFAEPLSLPPFLNYLDGPNTSSSPSGLFSPTHQQQQQPQQYQQQQSSVPGFIQQQQQQFLQQQYRFGGGNFATATNDGSEFASLPPRINHQSHPAQQAYQFGRRFPLQQQNSNSSFQDLVNSQRIMTDSYINDSSDNESKNSCAKSKQEVADALLADLNLLNANATLNSGGSGGSPGNGGFNGPSTGNASSNQNNLVLVLLKEIGKLHDTNKKICRNLHETKVEMEALKHTPHWGLSQRRDSISGLSTNSQPVGMRYNGFGLQSPAPTYHSQGNYTPGIVTDVIREIREVSRVREEALMERMKTMIEERSWSLNEANFRLLKESEEMKKSIHSVRSEMNQIVDRMLKLENEVINLKAQLNHQQQQQQNLAFRERDTFGPGLSGSVPAAAAGMAASKLRRNSLHLNYGRINNAEEFYGNNFSDVNTDLRYSNGSNMRKFGENNFGSTLNGGGFSEEMHDESSNDQVLLLEKDALKLRRELQDALASKQESENRITALENIVSTLKEQVPSEPAMVAPIPQHHASIVHHRPLSTSPAGPQVINNSSNNNNDNNGTLSSAGQQHVNSYYIRSGNNVSPNAASQKLPSASTSPKLQKAAQIPSRIVHQHAGRLFCT